MSGAPFSRIALAAALLEYDNDPEDPVKPKRFAQDSAIFAHLRRSGPVPKPESVLEYDDLPEPRRSKDFLKVPLPSDDTSLFSPMEPATGAVTSVDGRRSLDILREHGEQFFQGGQEDEYDENDSDDDVDLGTWGLDTFIPKGKAKDKPAKRPGPSRVRPASEHLDNLPSAQSPQRISYAQDAFDFANDPSSSAGPRARPKRTRSASFMNDLGFLDSGSNGPVVNTFPIGGRPQTSYVSELEDPISLDARPRSMVDPTSVPFPTSRPGTPGPDFGTSEEAGDPKFAVPLPPPERLSKFDPKAARRARADSVGSWLSDPGLKPNAEARPNLTVGSPRQRDENDPGDSGRPLSMAPSQVTEIRRLSKIELLRPKVLIMPSPLRDVNNVGIRSKADFRAREGFQETTGDRPLPAGFRESTITARPGVRPSAGSQSLGKMSNASVLMSNSRMSLSASQLMFRNSLMVGGQYLEDDQPIGRAQVDGEKVDMFPEDPEEIEAAYREMQHPTGKLLGRSLMDALAARKEQIKGKRRVFTGDGRHSMMDRSLAARSTLIDASTFDKPQIALVDSDGRPIKPGVNRQASKSDRRKSGAPLVDLGEGKPGLTAGMGTIQSRTSVFGVDTVWEREMSRLQEMEEAEGGAAARLHENETRKGKARDTNFSTTPAGPEEKMTSEMAPGGLNKLAPPTLPEVPLVSSRGRPRKPKVPDNEDDDDEGHGAIERRRVSTATLGVKGWFAGSSDDEDDRRPSSRMTRRFGASPSAQAPRLPPVTGDSEDEDVPLSQIKPTLKVSSNDSDEDEPLVQTISRLSMVPPALKSEPNPSPIAPPDSKPTPMKEKEDEDEDEDDNVPLGLRASVNLSSLHKPPANPGSDNEDEDEAPLGLRYGANTSPNASEQLRQQQMAMMLVQQQQQQAQQQMYLQQMARQSIAGFSNMGGAGLMAPPAFPAFGAVPPMGMFGVTAPVMPGPTGISMVNNPDSAKIGRVDAWRKSVAAEP